jgi:RNA polymerase sigma-70 factor (ECF subfamily)
MVAEGKGKTAMTAAARVDRTDRTDATGDAGLVAAVLAGDAEAFTALHDKYRDKVYRFALKRTGDEHDAEDVTQEVFLEIWRCLGSYEGRSSLLTWIFGIAHNQVCRRFRKKNLVAGSIDDEGFAEVASAEPGIEETLDARRLLEQCDRVVEGLSEAQRTVYQLRFREQRSTREVASALGKSSQAVKISLFRTRRALLARTPAAELELTAA